MNRFYHSIIACILLAFLSLPAFSQHAAAEARARVNAPVTLTFKGIPAEDVNNVSGVYPVSTDGTIVLPYLKSPVRVAGKTSREINNLLVKLYVEQKIYTHPIIESKVISDQELEEYRKRYIEVSGHVAVKKNLIYRPGITLSEAILDCGDITAYGSRKIQVTRKGQTREYDYFSARDRAIELHPKDKIYVKERGAFEARPTRIGP